MKLSIYLAETIRSVVKDKPPILCLESSGPLTIQQIVRKIGIPSALVVFASVDGVKMSLDDAIEKDAKVHLFGTMAGG